jgi:hypothetical protein
MSKPHFKLGFELLNLSTQQRTPIHGRTFELYEKKAAANHRRRLAGLYAHKYGDGMYEVVVAIVKSIPGQPDAGESLYTVYDAIGRPHTQRCTLSEAQTLADTIDGTFSEEHQDDENET